MQALVAHGRQCWVRAAASPGESGMGGSAGLEPQGHLARVLWEAVLGSSRSVTWR